MSGPGGPGSTAGIDAGGGAGESTDAGASGDGGGQPTDASGAANDAGMPATDAGAGADASGTVLADAAGADGATSGVVFAVNPNNVLSVIATVSLPGYDHAHVVSSNAAETLTTPEVSLDANGNGTIAVLGLAPSTTYSHVIEATGGGAVTWSTNAVSLTTPALPAVLSTVNVAITPITGSPEAGYYLVTGGGTVDFAFDASGTIRWYSQFGGVALQEGKMQYDSTFTSYVGGSTGSESVAGSYVRYRPDGTQIATYAVASPEAAAAPDGGSLTVYTDPHELLITNDGTNEHLHFFGYEDLPASATNATVLAWHQLVRQTTSGDVEFRWKSSSRFSYADRLETDIPSDLDHTNSIAIDPTDGNYVVSLRNFDALVKIDYDRGDVLWQLGGVHNQFTIQNDPLGGFYGEHSVRVLANGDILLYDNGLHHTPEEARAAEYALDTDAMTATLVWEYRRTPILTTEFVGSVERLTSGNTLVAFGWVGTVDEADPAGSTVWEAQLYTGSTARLAYRVRRLPSLYAYEVP